MIQNFAIGEEIDLQFYFEKHYASLVYFATCILKNEEAAKDIVLNSFVKLWEKRSKFSDAKGLHSYLFVIVKNACFSTIRKWRREKVFKESYEYQSSITDDGNCDLLCEKIKFHEKLLEEIEKLPRQCKAIMILTYKDGLDNRQIGEKLNLSPNTVKNQKSKGIKVLRERLHETSKELLY